MNRAHLVQDGSKRVNTNSGSATHQPRGLGEPLPHTPSFMHSSFPASPLPLGTAVNKPLPSQKLHSRRGLGVGRDTQ